MKPNPMAQSQFQSLVDAWKAYADADRIAVDWWHNGPVAGLHHEEKYKHPDSIAHTASKEAAWDHASGLAENLRVEYPWLPYMTPGYDLSGGVHGSFREALADHWKGTHTEEMAAFRGGIESPLSHCPPMEGHVYRTRPQGFLKITKVTHNGKRVFAEDMITGEVSRITDIGVREGGSPRGYHTVSEEWMTRALEMVKAYQEYIETNPAVTP